MVNNKQTNPAGAISFIQPMKAIFIFVGVSIVFLLLPLPGAFAQKGPRQTIPLNNNWVTIAADSNRVAYEGFEKKSFPTGKWKPVNVPHNWDGYEGFRRMRHGNRHGYAWYRKNFTLI